MNKTTKKVVEFSLFILFAVLLIGLMMLGIKWDFGYWKWINSFTKPWNVIAITISIISERLCGFVLVFWLFSKTMNKLNRKKTKECTPIQKHNE